MSTTAQHKALLEAALFSSPQPLSEAELARLFAEVATEPKAYVQSLIAALRTDYVGRGIELCPVAGGWRLQTRLELAAALAPLHPEKPPRYTRATLETLAVIAYRQPVTRGDIEQMRGVSLNPALLHLLQERGWVEVIGRRETPGRPELFATTPQFLADLGLNRLTDLPTLPPIAEMPDHGG
jgi:segregation and condensation protein B